MNYKSHYDKLISNRLKCPIKVGYTEKHHILPISLGGSDNNDNLINLTAKEHFIAHLLLTKMYKKKSVEYYKMIKAFGLMCWYQSDNQNRYISSNEYAWLREEFSKAQSKLQEGEKNSQYGTKWIYSETLRVSKKIPKSESIPEGWERGRVLDFDREVPDTKRLRSTRKLTKEEKANRLSQRLLHNKLVREEKKRMWDEGVLRRKREKEENTRSQYENWYVLYKEVGFEKFREITKYGKTQSNLVHGFKRWVREFKPFRGTVKR